MEAELRSVILATNTSLDELRDAHELLKKNHARTLEKLAAAEQRALDAGTKHEEAQAECREIYQEWSNQLSKQAEEFRQLESQMVPQHIVQMEKINLGNELRAKFEKELASLNEKLDTTQEELNKVKKESQNFNILWENAVTETDIIKTRLSKSMNSLQEEVELQKLCNLELEHTNSELNENIRQLESRIIDLSVSESHLRAAEQAARQDADEAIRSRCQLEQSHLRTVNELQSQCALIQAQLECHQAQVQEATSVREQALHNLKQSECKNKHYRIQIIELQQNLEDLRSQYDGLKLASQNDLSLSRKRLETMENEIETRLEDYQCRLNNQEKNEESLRLLHEKREKEIEIQYQKEMEQTKCKLVYSYNEVSKLKAEVDRLSDELMKQTVSYEQQLRETHQEKDNFKNAMEKATDKYEAQIKHSEKVHAELHNLKDSYDDLNKTQSSSLAKLKVTKESLTKETEQSKHLAETVERLQNKVKSLEEQSIRDSNEWRSEREALIRELSNCEKEIRKLQDQAVSKERDLQALQKAFEIVAQKSKKVRKTNQCLAKLRI